ncbi:MAG: PaaI family thioesterase [Actinomycetota bacterium]
MSDELTALLHASMPLSATIGIRARSMAADEVVAELDWAPELCTNAELLHGGTLMALADSIGAACAMANLPEGAAGTATIESKTNFLGGVREGTVVATSRPLHVGRRTIVIETEIHNGDKLVAKTTQTQAVL